ncbi:ABC transporter permease [Marinoscillum furvescens]|uniref:Putative ABC transport system permease protein n=1 Tax=Marinoscillum furvescens DSM 4134 TaxID=1122208 RepID=A0A3D9L4U9_MARFU|nr:ABC transporter permease [Marinoscillum furvescens]RED99434.1 putative ABC transport system permease protein [Marinoscillum furvescens DSM 4134]
MNIPYLSLKSLVKKPLTTFLSWLLLAFGVTIVVIILLASSQLKSEISKNAQGIDLVVGAKGSPLQLILANIFHVDFPTGNIGLKEAARVSKSRYIGSAIPLSLGDSYRGFRIVGSTQDYPRLYKAELAKGEWFEDHMEVVVGAEVAQKEGLSVGDTFESQHGLSEDAEAHGGHAFQVVGVMKPTYTVMDKLIVTGIHSVWEVHEHEGEHHHHEEDSLIEISHLGISVTSEEFDEKEITSLLISYRSPMGAVMLPRSINSESSFQAASPAFETARLFNIIGVGVKVLNGLGLLIIIISAISVFVALLNSLKERKFDIAIMRSMGATRRQIFAHILIEGLLITFAGAISGLVIAHVAMQVVANTIGGIAPEPWVILQEEWLVLAGCLAIGVVASLIPAVMAYKTDISKTLAKG